MILIIFIVNTSEFVYFFFNSGESHEGRQRLLVLLSPRGFRLNQWFPTSFMPWPTCRFQLNVVAHHQQNN